MKRARYEDNNTVPIGFLDLANAELLAAGNTYTSAAMSGDTVVRIAPVSADVWVNIGTAPGAPSAADLFHLIPLGGAQDIGVESGNKIRTSGEANITPFK